MSTLDGTPLGIFTPRRAAERQCGDCTLCCKLTPVRTIDKPRDTWCPHCDKKKGCKIYEERPTECRLWSCLWLIDAEHSEALHPKRTHCVFDSVVDQVIQDGIQKPVMQLWVDPAYPTAHRSMPVRREIERLADEFGLATLARLGYEGIVIVAPSLSDTGTWIELRTKCTPAKDWRKSDDWQIADFLKRHGKASPP